MEKSGILQNVRNTLSERLVLSDIWGLPVFTFFSVVSQDCLWATAVTHLTILISFTKLAATFNALGSRVTKVRGQSPSNCSTDVV